MNILEAKQEVKRTVEIYLDKDRNGEYFIPCQKQRPVFLLGAPGIGKTAIMEQIASELDIALISYSMTHHTRQSALGLPFIAEKEYDGKKYSVSDYTMSEIISSIYALMQASGKREGILFLDEINCVSETLAPVMLRFLQYKEFGNQRIPEGWVIVTAGNPPEYNRSAREFDVATLDRIKCLHIQEDFSVWKSYAYEVGISGAVLAFLELNREWFYSLQTGPDGVRFVTARGWEDLSLAMAQYEKKGFPVNTALISQYVTDEEIARKFSMYYDLYRKYQTDYHIDEILSGTAEETLLQKAKSASLDERIALLELLGEHLSGAFASVLQEEDVLRLLVKKLRVLKKALAVSAPPPASDVLESLANEIRREEEAKRAANSLSIAQRTINHEVMNRLELLAQRISPETDSDTQFKSVKNRFKAMTRRHENTVDTAGKHLEAAFRFIENVYGHGHELILFMTQLTANVHCMRFIETWGSESYFRNNRDLLIYDVQNALKAEIDTLEL